jgi:hypothetical protein
VKRVSAAVDAESSGCVYLLRWDGIEMTTDGGLTWSTTLLAAHSGSNR